MVLYKYRGFSNLQFVLDIFINKRLYASDFQDLNDPMEGAFIYSKGIFSEDEVNTIIGEKAEYKILSLSETSNNMLMWSYYAEAHQGFVVGVELSDNIDLRPVEYVESVPFISTVDNIAKSILTKKLKLWTHEQEHRAFKQYDKFVNVEIKELIFGLHSNSEQRELLTKIAKKFCPEIEVKHISRSELDK